MHIVSTRTSGCQYRLQRPGRMRPRHGTDAPRIPELYRCPFSSRLQILAIGTPRTTPKTLYTGVTPPSHRGSRLACMASGRLPNGRVARSRYCRSGKLPWKRAFHRYPLARSGAAFALNKAHNRTKVDSPLVCHQTCSSPQQSPAATIMGGRSRQRQEKPVMGCPTDAGIDRSSINRQLPIKGRGRPHTIAPKRGKGRRQGGFSFCSGSPPQDRPMTGSAKHGSRISPH